MADSLDRPTAPTTAATAGAPDAIPPEPIPEVPFSSNSVRLSGWQWVSTAVVVMSVLGLLPRVWLEKNPLRFPADYRLPNSLSEDYWLYRQWTRQSAAARQIAVIGDSVVWGDYVLPQQTLTHYLNQQAGSERFSNGGLNGAHPLALGGLVQHYATPVTDAAVILQCNLLWMSSPERDLQVDKEQRFNHGQLVPQFFPRIPCYRASFEERMGIVVDRQLGFRGLVQHIRITYLDGLDLHRWSLDHPTDNPFTGGQRADQLDESSGHRPVPWNAQGIERQDMPWIALDSSRQWQAFRRAISCLQGRGNRVLVLLCPLNEHLLTDSSQRRYRGLRDEATRWLGDQQVPYVTPELLPSEEYADASHPLAAGYARLARMIYADAAFQQWFAAPP